MRTLRCCSHKQHPSMRSRYSGEAVMATIQKRYPVVVLKSLSFITGCVNLVFLKNSNDNHPILKNYFSKS